MQISGQDKQINSHDKHRQEMSYNSPLETNHQYQRNNSFPPESSFGNYHSVPGDLLSLFGISVSKNIKTPISLQLCSFFNCKALIDLQSIMDSQVLVKD
mgnify:FL=1